MPDSTESAKAKGWAHLLAGSAAGCSAVLVLHPFDVIKTRLQVQDGTSSAIPAYKSSTHAARTILASEGLRGLYAGLTPSLVGSTVSWGAYLYLYDRMKAWHRSRNAGDSVDVQEARLSAVGNLVSAAEAGALVCCVTNPIWLVKTRLALQQRGAPAVAATSATPLAATYNTAAQAAATRLRGQAAPGRAYEGMLDAFVTIGRSEGLRGYYKGFGPSLVLQTAHGAIQFAVYEELKQRVAAISHCHTSSSSSKPSSTSQPPIQADRQLSAAEISLCGAGSKVIASIATYPVQVIRSRLQQRSEGRQLLYRNSWQAIVTTRQREGLRGFYKSLAPSLLRTMPQSAVTLTVYEWLVKVLES